VGVINRPGGALTRLERHGKRHVASTNFCYFCSIIAYRKYLSSAQTIPTSLSTTPNMKPIYKLIDYCPVFTDGCAICGSDGEFPVRANANRAVVAGDLVSTLPVALNFCL